MYKLTYQELKEKVEILQVSVKSGDSWELLKDQEIVEKVEKAFLKNKIPRNNVKIGYGEAVYSPNMNYITGKFEIVE
jgi:hypothetical protein